MSDWINDLLGSADSDPEFGSIPARREERLERLVESLLGDSASLRSPLRELRDSGLRSKLALAKRELRLIHQREEQRLLVAAARIKAHSDPEFECRERARAMWAGPLLSLAVWREQCREELISARGTWRRPPKILRRLYRGSPDSWPAAPDLVRAALQLGTRAQLEIDLVRAAFAVGDEIPLAPVLERHWQGNELSKRQRSSLLRSLAVLHEANGAPGKAEGCWRFVIDREPVDLLAHLSCFSLALAAAEESRARAAARALVRTLATHKLSQGKLERALRERAWISRVSPLPLTDEARELRLDLIASGEVMLSKLCLEIA